MLSAVCSMRNFQKRLIKHNHEIDIQKQPDVLLNRNISKESKTAKNRRRQPPTARMLHDVVYNCGDRYGNEQRKKSGLRDMISAYIRKIKSGNAEKKRNGEQDTRVKNKREKRGDNRPEENADKGRFFVRFSPCDVRLCRLKGQGKTKLTCKTFPSSSLLKKRGANGTRAVLTLFPNDYRA